MLFMPHFIPGTTPMVKKKKDCYQAWLAIHTIHTIQNVCCALDGKWQCSYEQAGIEKNKMDGSVHRCGEGMMICTRSM